MTGQALPDPDRDVVTAQLFRYAQDMEELMRQHNRLQRQHQMLLQSLGKEVNGADLLPRLLMQASPMYWVTDAQGLVRHASSRLRWQFAQQLGTLVGCDIAQHVRVSPDLPVQALLERVAEQVYVANAVHCRVEMSVPTLSQPGMQWDALLMSMQVDGRVDVYWFLSPAVPGEDSLLQAQSAFSHAVDSEHGMLVANPFGTMTSASSGFCRMSGYAEAELVGNNPRMLSSGRHDAEFYQTLWLELLDMGRWSGTIFNRRKDGQIYLQWQTITMVEGMDGQVISYIAAVADLSHNETSSKRLEALAYTDPLTGLPNRRRMVEHLERFFAQASPESDSLALLFIDLNRFKPINDELGHDVGDLVLQQVATRMRNAMPAAHLLARVGGDEFVVVLAGIAQAEQAEVLATQLQQALKAPMFIKERKLSVGASIGCARYPRDAEDMAKLLQCADVAMYSAKRFGIPFCEYDASMGGKDKPNLERDLWLALERNEISLVYQPQMRSDIAGTVRGCEALMRWQRPGHGLVMPGGFIDVAEETGCIVQMGRWLADTAVSQAVRWLQAGRACQVAINVSALEFAQPDFVQQVANVLQRSGLPAHLLELELTESILIRDVNEAQAKLKALQALGVHLALDDFGTGYSSLTYLKRFVVHRIKIDQSFVRSLPDNTTDQAIVDAIVRMGHALSMDVVAEGVEHAPQLEWLKTIGCDQFQGFLFSRAVPADDMARLLGLGTPDQPT